MIINLRKLLIVVLSAVIAVTVISICPALADNVTVKLPILMYHHISEKSSKLNKYTISPSEFENDLNYIQTNGYTTVGVNDLIEYTNGKEIPEKPIMITFDDGYQSVYKYAFPLLKERNMKAVVNIIGKYAQMYSEIDDDNVNYAHINFQRLSEMLSSGLIEIGNHTYDMHTGNGIQKTSKQTESKYTELIEKDITYAQKLFTDNIKTTPRAFAYPFGKISKQALPVLKKAGFSVVFCCWEKVNTLSGNPEELYHLNRFNRPHGKSAEKIISENN